MREVEIDKQTAYASEDTDVTLQLKKIFEQELTKNAHELMTKLNYPVEFFQKWK